MLDSFNQVFGTANFIPHGHCFLWTPSLLWTYVLSDSVIAASYYSIPVALWYFATKRQDLPYRWVFILFGIFVIACGTTHLFAILVIWQPYYFIDAGIKAMTAAVSALGAIALWRIMPLALALPSRSQLDHTNNQLQDEIKRREQTEAELLKVNKLLEERVAFRTAKLLESNASLQRLNSTLVSLSKCNELLIHATDEPKLLDDMCRMIVDDAGYKLAWVGYVEHDTNKTVRPITNAGYEQGYMERAQVTWADNPNGRGPSGTAIRTQKPAIVRDTLTDPDYSLWRDNSIKLGYRSILALPLVTHGQILGALTIYSTDADGFSEEEIKLGAEFSNDLAFGIVTLRTRKLQEQSAERLLHSLEGIIEVIAATVEMRDPYTAGHQHRVAELSKAIAEELELPEEDIRGIYLAAQIHDLGKISIPAEILSKPSRLTALEYQIVQTHVQAGYDILKKIDFPWPIAQLVYQHHERPDGSGYPNGLKEADILTGAKILAVADTVEAMSSHRPYRPGLGIEAALEEIRRNRGTLYCPDAVDACLRLFLDRGYKLPV